MGGAGPLGTHVTCRVIRMTCRVTHVTCRVIRVTCRDVVKPPPPLPSFPAEGHLRMAMKSDNKNLGIQGDYTHSQVHSRP